MNAQRVARGLPELAPLPDPGAVRLDVQHGLVRLCRRAGADGMRMVALSGGRTTRDTLRALARAGHLAVRMGLDGPVYMVPEHVGAWEKANRPGIAAFNAREDARRRAAYRREMAPDDDDAKDADEGFDP